MVLGKGLNADSHLFSEVWQSLGIEQRVMLAAVGRQVRCFGQQPVSASGTRAYAVVGDHAHPAVAVVQAEDHLLEEPPRLRHTRSHASSSQK